MNSVVVYSVQLQAMMAGSDGFGVSGICGTLPQLMDQIGATHPCLVLMELTPDVTLDVLERIRTQAGGRSIILWGDAVPAEFAAQAIRLGVRGILRWDLREELRLKELREESTGRGRLPARTSVALTSRERERLGCLEQGLTNKQIAHSMGITEGTVKVSVSRLLDKVGASDRVHLGSRASVSGAGQADLPAPPAAAAVGEHGAL